jgi:hypothetical protein
LEPFLLYELFLIDSKFGLSILAPFSPIGAYGGGGEKLFGMSRDGLFCPKMSKMTKSLHLTVR